MDKIYAVVEDGTVINIVILDGKSEWKPESGKAILGPVEVGIGWSYSGKKFTPNDSAD